MTAPQTHRATIENGPSVVNGALVWTSATGITTADPNSFGGCTRKWWYDYVALEKAPATKAMMAGTALHTEIENHLRLGHSLQSPLALSGFMFVPRPGPGLEIERPIHFETAGGVGIFGHVDLYNLRGEYVDAEGALQRDTPNTFEVKDWKTTSDFQYAKSERDLKENIQLITYAEAGFRRLPGAERSRLTHVYFRTRGAPASKLVTVSRTRAEVAARWQYSESVVRTMSDAAREATADTVPGNRKACDAYNGCPHRDKCGVYKFSALDSVYGKIGEDYAANNTTSWGVPSAQPNQEIQMGLLTNSPSAPAPAAQPDMRQQLAAEEAQQRAAVAQQQAQMPQPLNTAQLGEVCQRLTSYGYGFPMLTQNAASAFALLNGQQLSPGAVYNGIPAQAGARRSLHQVQLSEVAHIYQLEGELAAERAKEIVPTQQIIQAAPVQAVVQQVAAQPGPAFTQQLAAQYNAQVVPQGGAPVSFLPPGAPESMPALAMQRSDTMMPQVPQAVAAQAPDPMQAAPEAGKKKSPGRPKKDKPAESPIASGAPASAVTAPPGLASTGAMTTYAANIPDAPIGGEQGTYTPDGFGTRVVLVNCRSEGIETSSLASYVDYINEAVSKKYNVGKDGRVGILDVRAAVDGSVLGYGGWKGAVREVVKVDQPGDGLYHLDTHRDDLTEAVVDGLRQAGWLIVRGVFS